MIRGQIELVVRGSFDGLRTLRTFSSLAPVGTTALTEHLTCPSYIWQTHSSGFSSDRGIEFRSAGLDLNLFRPHTTMYFFGHDLLQVSSIVVKS